MKWTQLDICNRALRLISEPVLTSLSLSSKIAEECNFFYPLAKDELIGAYHWRCTQRTSELVAIYEDVKLVKVRPYKHKFLLPFDCVTVRSVDLGNSFIVDGIYLYADQSTVSVCYSARIREDFMNLRLAKLIALKLACELCLVLAKDSLLLSRMENLYEVELRKAQQLDSQEGSWNYETSAVLNNQVDWLSCR